MMGDVRQIEEETTETVVNLQLQRVTDCRGNAFKKEIRRYFDNDRRIKTPTISRQMCGGFGENSIHAKVPFQHSHD
jgi:hypothetical protein